MQIAALCAVSAVLSLLLRRRSPEFSYLLALGCCAAALMGVKALIEPVLRFFEQLAELAGLEGALLAPVIKTVAIGLLSQITGAFCLDAGEKSLAKVVEISGTFLALYTALPLAEEILQNVRTLIGG